MAAMDWKQLLSPIRIRELMTGRDTSPADHRSQFRRDFDRIMFSFPVRRLQDKAQVFPLEPNDAVRNRLTHSLEVSCVARGMAESVTRQLVDAGKMTAEQAEDAQTIAATVGLIHDLGNPPFGHSGEDAIRSWFSTRNQREHKLKPANRLFARLASGSQQSQDFLRFEGNAQTIRLLCHLQILADQWGLNPTVATLSAALKYIAPSHARPSRSHAHSKPGYLWAERDIVERVQREAGTRAVRNPLAFLVETADDAVYSLVDIEDAIKKGVLTWADLKENRQERSLTRKGIDSNDVAACGRHFGRLLSGAERQIDAGLDRSQLSLPRRALDYAYAQAFRTQGMSMITKGISRAFRKNYEAIMHGDFDKELVTDTSAGPARSIVLVCKAIGRVSVYPTRDNVELELRGREIIHGLLDVLWEGIGSYNGQEPAAKTFAGKAWALVSESYRSVFKNSWAKAKDDRERQYYKLLLLTDYVSGMTDAYASALHRSLKNGL